jgi:hypothetical protein
MGSISGVRQGGRFGLMIQKQLCLFDSAIDFVQPAEKISDTDELFF